MTDLYEHQREALAVADGRNVLLCSAHRVGKTFLAAMRVRAFLHAADVHTSANNGNSNSNNFNTNASSTNSTTTNTNAVVAVAPTPEARNALHLELARLCSEPVWIEPADEADPSTVLVQRLRQDGPSPSHARVRVAVVSPRLLQNVLRKRLMDLRDIGLLVFEGADEIHDAAPSLYRVAFEPLSVTGGTAVGGADAVGDALPCIFATARTPASALAWDPRHHPLYRHIHVLNLIPVLASETVAVLQGRATPPLPLVLVETFDRESPTSHSHQQTTLSCAVRDFLLGENDRKLDFVRLFRLEMEMGNSAAVYDDKKKQERVNRFIADAESVYTHLGLWCLYKYVELELQFNLQACLVEDVDNINRRRRRQQQLQQQQLQRANNPEEVSPREEDAAIADDGDGDVDGSDLEEADEAEQVDNAGAGASTGESLAALFEVAALTLDEAKKGKIQSIIKVLASLAASAVKLGADAATPRLLKVAAITQNRLAVDSRRSHSHDSEQVDQVGSRAPRCWVFVERRAHCTVVAEYLSFALRGLDHVPPCCSMLGHSNARVVGSLHFSSYLKVITLFASGGTRVLVTTSIAKQSQRVRVEPPQCDLVVVMDEILEPDKLLDYCERAFAGGGVVKVVLPRGRAEAKKFQLVVRKFKELVQVEQPPTVDYNDVHDDSAAMTTSAIPVPRTVVEGTGKATSASEVAVNLRSAAMPSPTSTAQSPRKPSVGTDFPPLRNAAAALPTYELTHKDTGAVLNLTNSVVILSKFCSTLPGLDTYDRRAQYYIKRHPIAGPTMTASLKQAKKKKFKYNSKLEDKIDVLAAQAETRNAASAEANSDVQDKSASSSGRFMFTAKLRLPTMLGMKKEIGSPKVASDVEAKAIVAFKACQALVKRGFVDRHFCSTLEVETWPESSAVGDAEMETTVYVDDEGQGGATAKATSLTDLSAQNSYDLPPVSAVELGLPTVRSLMEAAKSPANGAEEATVSMCFYGIEGVRFAILSSQELYTGNTNTGWRYDFATSDVMEPTVNRVTLQKTPSRLQLTKTQLEQALHFHLIIMRLACMNVDDAMREVDIAGDRVWDEFSKQNDKGYLVVPSCTGGDGGNDELELDWDYVREIVGQPLLVDCWPLPDASAWPSDEWVCVPKQRRNVCYVVRSVSADSAGETVKPIAEMDAAWAAHFKTKAVAGVPILGRWHTREQVQTADASQPLLHGVQVPQIVPLIRRVMQRHLDDVSVAQSRTRFQERFLLPEYTALVRLTKTRYFEAMGVVPLLYEFERKCQMSQLMRHIGLELDLRLLDDATTKPAYERLEILGDTFLKLETSWHLFQHRADITEEGQLTQLRRDIIRNDRLNLFALAKNVHHFMIYPAEIEQHPFKFWKPSCMGATPESVVAPSKWVADVLEAICGAYLVGHGETGARHFLDWVGIPVPRAPHALAAPYLPDYLPNELYADFSPAVLARQRDVGFSVEHADGVERRLVAMQQRLKYTFSNKLLLLEALTHPSVGVLALRHHATGASSSWRGNYERLEYLGDAVIEYLTLAYAFLHFRAWLPGALSQWKSATVSNDALGKTALACFGVDECLLAGKLSIDRETRSVIAGIERRYTRDDALTVAPPPAPSYKLPPSRSSKKAKALTELNSMALPKVFADVFEALVAAVFLDSGHSLHAVRDVFLGPLLDTVGADARAYVCRASGLPMDDEDPRALDMEELQLLSDDEDELLISR